ncbi:MAG: DivIVA domain-containing protein [Actinomycetota bacterium]|nr:DivIVA domain-containing protein [Actinomycetota bacterium]
MSAGELDLPLLPSAEQIRRREFATIRRGYDPEQVRDYLRQVAAQVETLEGQLRDARLEMESGRQPAAAAEPQHQPEPQLETAPSADPYEQLAGRLSELMRAADGQAQKILSDAQAEATRQMTEARAEADRVRTDAQSQAEEARQHGDEVLHHAKAEAERVLSTLSSRREHLVDQLQQMQSRLLGVAQELESALGEDDVDDGFMGSSAPTPQTGGEGVVDPHYEDLWVSETEVMKMTDLPAIDIDFGDVEGEPEQGPASEPS